MVEKALDVDRRLVLPLAALAGEGALFGALATQIGGRPGPPPVTAVLLAAVAAAAIVGVLALWFVLRAARRTAPASSSALSPRRLAALARVGAPVAFAPLLVVAAHPSSWFAPDLLVALTVLVLGFERLLRQAFRAWPEAFPAAGVVLAAPVDSKGVRWWRRLPWPWLVVLLGALAYAVYMSLFTIWNHRRFGTFGFDLGLYNNLFFNELKGHPMRCPALGIMENWEELKNHAELSSFVFLPLYALHPDSETLLLLQSTLLGLGAIPVFRFARRRVPDGVAATLAIAYLFFAPTHGASFYDFHFQPVAAFFVLLTIDFLDEGRYVLSALAALIAFGCREDISVGLAVAGAAFALSGRRFWGGLSLAVASSVYFVVIRFIVMPHFGTWWFADIYRDLYPDGARSFGGVMQTIVSNPLYTFRTLLTPAKLGYALAVLLPVGLLPLRRPALLVALIPGSLFTLLTTGYAPTVDTGFQYSCHYLAYIFPAAAIALAWMKDDRPVFKAAVGALVLGTFLTTANWGAFPPRESIHGGFGHVAMKAPTREDRQRERDLRALAARLPPEATVAISEQEMPHVNFVQTLCLRDGWVGADYILYGVTSGFYGGNNAQHALESGEYEKLDERSGIGLLGRKGRPFKP